MAAGDGVTGAPDGPAGGRTGALDALDAPDGSAAGDRASRSSSVVPDELRSRRSDRSLPLPAWPPGPFRSTESAWLLHARSETGATIG
ncbi:MAG TPA: hypothetical protein VGO86_01080, partial [Candidatus Dormibacteraeota bacterium]